MRDAVLHITFEVPYTVEAFEALDDSSRAAYDNPENPADMAYSDIRYIKAGKVDLFAMLDADADADPTFEVVER
jgi:hypothetical protein